MDLLFRLVKNNTIVGYQKQENGKIYHKQATFIREGETYVGAFEDIFIGDRTVYIPHDRIDRDTGIEIGGAKLFERDRLSWEESYPTRKENEKRSGTIELFRGEYRVKHDNDNFDSPLYYVATLGINAKIIGMEGDPS